MYKHGTGLLNYYNDGSVEIKRIPNFNISKYFKIPLHKKLQMYLKINTPNSVKKLLIKGK